MEKEPEFHFIWILICWSGMFITSIFSVGVSAAFISSTMACLILALISYLIYKSKLNDWAKQYVKEERLKDEYIKEEQRAIEKYYRAKEAKKYDEMEELEEELKEQYKKFKLLNEKDNNSKTNLKYENKEKIKQVNNQSDEKYLIVENFDKRNYKVTNQSKQRLKDDFYDYLLENGYKEYTQSGNRSTIYNYIKGIDYVVSFEGFSSWFELIKNIDEIIKMYDVGGFREGLGKKSNKTIINALKRFNEFLYEQGYK